MKKPWYAFNARKLLEAREKGLTPEEPVVVSLLDRGIPDSLVVKEDMPTERLDWRMLVNVDVWMVAGKLAPLGWLLETASRIAHARPASLCLRFDHEGLHDLEIGTATHLPAVRDIPAQHAFTWVPINYTGSAIGAKLRQALIDKHPRWTVL